MTRSRHGIPEKLVRVGIDLNPRDIELLDEGLRLSGVRGRATFFRMAMLKYARELTAEQQRTISPSTNT